MADAILEQTLDVHVQKRTGEKQAIVGFIQKENAKKSYNGPPSSARNVYLHQTILFTKIQPCQSCLDQI